MLREWSPDPPQDAGGEFPKPIASAFLPGRVLMPMHQEINAFVLDYTCAIDFNNFYDLKADLQLWRHKNKPIHTPLLLSYSGQP